MSIPEDQLDIWAKQGSVAQSRDTYGSIKRVLETPGTAYAGRDFTVFLQGSYGNDTNVYAESDVDVVIVLNETYYEDLGQLSEAEKGNFNQSRTPADYSYWDFRRDVQVWLVECYGKSVEPGNKAIFIPADGARRNADVIIAAQYQLFERFRTSYDEDHIEGICFWNKSLEQIANFPKQHSANCTTKHQATAGYFKPMVRIIKNMRNRMIADGKLESGIAPSYYLEGLLYNVPNDQFGQSYSDTFVNCYNWLLNADRSDFVCANETYFLLREGSPVTWRADKCSQFLDAAGDYWREW